MTINKQCNRQVTCDLYEEAQKCEIVVHLDYEQQRRASSYNINYISENSWTIQTTR